jgi:hypothetical protein
MNYGLVGLYGLYLVFVGANKNTCHLKNYISSDAKEFSIWIVAIVVLKWLDSYDNLKPFVTPFIYLAILTFVLKNYDNLVLELNNITGTQFKAVKK